MSRAEYWQRGEAIDFKNETETVIEANEIVTFGKKIGVSGVPIAPGETGTLFVFGVFDMPKSSANVIAAGTTVYFDGTGITEEADGNTEAGYSIEAAGAEAKTIKVKLLG